MADALPFDPTAPRTLPKPGPRKPLSKHDYAEMFLAQMGKCFNCGERLKKGNVIDEHIIPRETLPADRCDALENRKLACRSCAKAKTVDDQAVIAKGRRRRREKGQQARRQARGESSIKSRSTFSDLPKPQGTGGGFRKPKNYVSPLSKKYRDAVKARVEK